MTRGLSIPPICVTSVPGQFRPPRRPGTLVRLVQRNFCHPHERRGAIRPAVLVGGDLKLRTIIRLQEPALLMKLGGDPDLREDPSLGEAISHVMAQPAEEQWLFDIVTDDGFMIYTLIQDIARTEEFAVWQRAETASRGQAELVDARPSLNRFTCRSTLRPTSSFLVAFPSPTHTGA